VSQPEFAAEKQTPQNLKKEALLIRERLREARRSERMAGFPAGRRWLYGVCIFGMLGAAFLLIASDPVRQATVRLMAGTFINLDVGDDLVFDLPPPPPIATETKTGPGVQFQGSTITFSDQGFEGVLYADTDPTWDAKDAEASKEEGFVPPAKTSESESAFALLKEKSAVAAQIVAGEKEGYEFKEWSPVRVDPPVFFIDLLVTQLSSGTDSHLIWEVNLDAETVKPMSQAARDLVR
jgi:hypothetical protein